MPKKAGKLIFALGEGEHIVGRGNWSNIVGWGSWLPLWVRGNAQEGVGKADSYTYTKGMSRLIHKEYLAWESGGSRVPDAEDKRNDFANALCRVENVAWVCCAIFTGDEKDVSNDDNKDGLAQVGSLHGEMVSP